MVIPWYNFSMKIALSIPDDVFESAETLSKRLGVSRSRLYATAVAEFVVKHRSRKITERLNAIYADDGELDPGVARAQRRSIERQEW